MQTAPAPAPDSARAEALGQLCGVGFVFLVVAVGLTLGVRRLVRGRRRDPEP